AQLQGKVSERELGRIGEFLRSVEAQTFVRSVAIAEVSQEIPRQKAAFRAELAALLILIARLGAASAGPGDRGAARPRRKVHPAGGRRTQAAGQGRIHPGVRSGDP